MRTPSTIAARPRRSFLLAAGLAATLSAVGCRQAPAPDYLRLSGDAPRVGGVPSSGAVLLTFWESWCAPCREEAPGLVRLARTPPAGLRVMVVSRDSDPAAVQRTFGDGSVLHRTDRDGTLFQAFGVDRLPASILVVDGRLVARFDGQRDWTAPGTRRLLERLPAERETARRPTP